MRSHSFCAGLLRRYSLGLWIGFLVGASCFVGLCRDVGLRFMEVEVWENPIFLFEPNREKCSK